MDHAVQVDAELRRMGLGDMAVLHDHLISYITFLLDLEDVVRLSCCSRILRVFACEEPLWLGLCLKVQEGVVEYRANWRQTALAAYSAKPVPPEAVQAAARPLPPLPGLSSLFLYKRWYRCHVNLTAFLPPPGAATVERVDAAAMPPGEFVRRYDKPSLPVLLGGLMDGWPASSWSLPALCASFPSALFKVSKPHGGRALMALPAYVDYMARQADEEPLYVFDATFAEAAPGIRKLYDVPHVFAQDFYSELQGARPHYRWLVLGPARSGASWHVDPALTSAWNALLSGRKRWALYPPHVRPPGLVLDGDGEGDGEEAHPSDDSLTSLQWFLEVYPTLPPEMRPIELVQNPGDVVFVPGGWWHCVLNLDTSVAVTQNYVGEANLDRVVRYMADGSAAYHRHPLAYYDPGVEAAAWADKYPHLPDPNQEEEEEDEEEEEERTGLAAAEEEFKQEQQQQASKRRQRRRRQSPGQQQQHHGSEALPDAVEGREGVGEGGAKAAKKARREEPPHAAPAVVGKERVARGLYFRSLVGGGGEGGQEGQRAYDVGGGGCGCLRAGGDGAAATTANGHVAASADGGGGDGGEDVGDGSGGGGGEVAGSLGALWPGELEYAEVAVWRRERILGRWLRRLWLSQPATRPAIQDCLFRHLHGGFWGEVLRVIAHQQRSLFGVGGSAAAADGATCGSGGGGISRGGCAQPSEPTPLELIPLMGADAIVFLYGGTAIKIFAHEVPAMRGLMCALEARAPQLLLPRPAAATQSQTAAAAVAAVAAAAADGAASAGRAGAAAASGLAHADGPASPAAAPHLPLPQPLAWGAVAAALTPKSRCPSPSCGEESTAEEDNVEPGPSPPPQQPPPQQPLLYVVQQQLQGSLVLQELLDQDLDPERQGQEQGWGAALARRHLTTVAEALGDLLGAMHATAAADAAAATAPACGGRAAAAPETPLPAAAAAAAPMTVEEWDAVVRHRAVWHDRYGSIWVSGLGGVGSASDNDDDDDGGGAVAASVPAEAEAKPEAGGACAAADAAPGTSAPGAASGGGGGGGGGAARVKDSGSAWLCNVPMESRWWPFVQHLRQRRRRLLRDLPSLSLPAWVKDQLPAYLPADPAQLLGFRPAAAGAAAAAAAAAAPSAMAASGGPDGPGVPPLLLHGDVTAHNVVISQPPPPPAPLRPQPQVPASCGTAAEDAAGTAGGKAAGGDAAGGGGGGGVAGGGWRPQLSLVDLSDAGHGDPLYELLPVLGSCLRCDAAAAARFWDSYRAHVDPGAAWPRRRLRAPPRDGDGDGAEELQLSYCAMCYCLLHEEAELLLDRVWRATEEPATAAATATAAQRTLAGLAVRLWGFLDEGREGHGGEAAVGGEAR